MPRIISFVSGFAVAVGLAVSSLIVLAQSDLTARFAPFVIDINQAVPVEVSVPVIEDGETVSKTVPLTVSVALQVRVDGPQDATVKVLEAPTPVVAVATATKMPSELPTNPSDVVVVGDIEWKLLDVQFMGQTLKSDNAFIEELKTTGQFVRVTFAIKNIGKETVTYTGINLIDGNGRSYEPSPDSLMRIASEEQCVFEQINPDIARHCTVVYEISSDATGLQIQFSDLNRFGGETQNVSIESQ